MLSFSLVCCHMQVVRDLVTIFPVLRDWIQEFLSSNRGMIATSIGYNMLIEQVSYEQLAITCVLNRLANNN